VRMAVHAGEALRQDAGYVGMEVHRGARIMASGHGGQVLLSSAAAALVRDQLPTDAGLEDIGEYEFKDLAHPERVFQLTHPDLSAGFPPLKTAAARSNLPAETSTFIGREDELREIGSLVDDRGVRLLTLIGPGGTGKTRLAVRVAEDHSRGFEDGVFFVDLSSVSETNAALAVIVQSLGLKLLKGQSAIELLKHHLRAVNMLLLLDNFEQLMSAAPVVARLLEACPRLSLLVTSREPLHLRAEHLFRIGAMALPPVGAQMGAANVGSFESIQLFVERARAANPDFRMTDENSAAIVEICRRVDGLPLAIELATAWLKLFSPDALRDRLGSRLDLLRGGPRDLPERQQTIRATIEWSWELLEPGEQRLFEVLSVFSSADYDAIQAVTSALDAHAGIDVDALEGLASLLDKSLVRHIPGAIAPRVGMLQTIREYASDRLRMNPSLEDAARRSHALYFSPLAAAPDTSLDEIENLRAAWRYWVGKRDLDRLNAMADGLWRAHEALGRFHATIEQASELLDVLASFPSSPGRTARRVELQVRRLRAMLVVEGYTKEVEEAGARAVESFEAEGAGVAEFYPVLRMLASLYGFRTEFGKSVEIADKIIELANARDDGDMRATGHVLYGGATSWTGDLQGSSAHFDEALAWYSAHPPSPPAPRWGVHSAVAAHNASALNLGLLGFPDLAANRAHRGIEVAEGLGDPNSVAYANYHTGFLHLWRQEPDLVRQYGLGVLDAIRDQEIAIWRALGDCLLGAANVGLGAGEEGIAQLDSSLETYRGIRTPPIFWPFLLLVQAWAYSKTGRIAGATALLDEAMATPGYERFPQFALLKGELVLAVPASDSEEVAEAYFRGAYEGSEAMGALMPQLQAATEIRRLGLAHGTDQGLAELQTTYALFTEGFDTRHLVAARELLAH
jgi:predicted ATPase